LSGFSRLERVSGRGVITIGEHGLQDCIALTEMDFPLVESIGESAFSGCIALATGRFLKASDFGNYAFNGCTALTTLVLGDKPPTLGLIFDSLKEQAITFSVPVGKTAVYKAAYDSPPWGGTNVTVVIVEEAE
jgi:hypothetical protein